MPYPSSWPAGQGRRRVYGGTPFAAGFAGEEEPAGEAGAVEVGPGVGGSVGDGDREGESGALGDADVGDGEGASEAVGDADVGDGTGDGEPGGDVVGVVEDADGDAGGEDAVGDPVGDAVGDGDAAVVRGDGEAEGDGEADGWLPGRTVQLKVTEPLPPDALTAVTVTSYLPLAFAEIVPLISPLALIVRPGGRSCAVYCGAWPRAAFSDAICSVTCAPGALCWLPGSSSRIPELRK
jgi:hypothetical protein